MCSIEPIPAEELTEPEGNVWKRCFVMDSNKSAIVNFFLPFCLCDGQNWSQHFIRAIQWACGGSTNMHAAHMIHYIYIYIFQWACGGSTNMHAAHMIHYIYIYIFQWACGGSTNMHAAHMIHYIYIYII